MRVGILGGTFNPPHLGHLVCSQEAYLQLELERVMLIPVHTAPHKEIEGDPGVDHRLQMCRLAIEGDEQRMEVSDLEARRAGTSYTVDTLQELHSAHPDNELVLIIGGDVAAGFRSWHEPERVLSLARLAVASRPGTSARDASANLDGLTRASDTSYFAIPEIGVSSTMLRERIRAREPTKYLMPDSVRRYVDEHALYRGVSRL